MTISAAMEKVLTVVVLVALSVSQGATEELKLNASSTYISLNAKGIAIISKQPDIEDDNNKITIKIHSLEQVTSNGSSERNEDLSTLNFVSGHPEEKEETVRVLTTSSTKINGCNIAAQVTILKRKVKGGDAGDIAIQFQLREYAFSKNDNKLKMTLMIKGKLASPTKISTNDDMTKYDLGGKGVLKLPKQVTLTDGDKFTIEFAKGGRIEYDVMITPADVSSSDSSTKSSSPGDGSTKSTSLCLAMMAILMLLRTV